MGTFSTPQSASSRRSRPNSIRSNRSYSSSSSPSSPAPSLSPRHLLFELSPKKNKSNTSNNRNDSKNEYGRAAWAMLAVGAALCFISACACIVYLHNDQQSSKPTIIDGNRVRMQQPRREQVTEEKMRRLRDVKKDIALESANQIDLDKSRGTEDKDHHSREENVDARDGGRAATNGSKTNGRGVDQDGESTQATGPDKSSTDSSMRSANPDEVQVHLKLPYYMYGKFSKQNSTSIAKGVSNAFQSDATRKEIINTIYDTPTRPIVDFASSAFVLESADASSPRKLFEDQAELLPTLTWNLHSPLLHGTRNHDCVMLFDDHASKDQGTHVHTLNILGRYNRHVEVIDMITGTHQDAKTSGTDPSGKPLNDLNHVSAVLVDAIVNGTIVASSVFDRPKQEVWLPCGFHGDAVNSETSSEYVRIVDVDTMKIRAGPKLPSSGGACTSAALSILPGEPPMICSFAGTRGKHDSGEFLPQTQCYDRIREQWWSPFGEMPYGLDHGNIAIIPKATCHRDDSMRIIIFNFRTEPYGDIHPEIMAHDIPKNGWTLDQLQAMKSIPNRKGRWYLYMNDNTTDPATRPEDVPRDAAGIVVTDRGRRILNFGGEAHDITREEHRATGRKRNKIKFSMVRSLDVCEKKWSVAGDFRLSTFALQSCASERLQVAFTCGGEAPLHESNSNICFASHWEGIHIDNQHEVINI